MPTHPKNPGLDSAITRIRLNPSIIDTARPILPLTNPVKLNEHWRRRHECADRTLPKSTNRQSLDHYADRSGNHVHNLARVYGGRARQSGTGSLSAHHDSVRHRVSHRSRSTLG